jgi:hypothetical protein
MMKFSKYKTNRSNTRFVCAWRAVLLVLVCGAGSVTAGPLIAPVRPGTQWTMEIDAARRKKAAETKEEIPQPVTPVRLKVSIDSKGLEQRVLTLSDGSTQTCYGLQGVLYQAIPNSTEVLALPNSALQAFDPGEWRVAGFPATAWIEAKYLVGREKVDDTECSRYHRPATIGSDGEARPEMTAWIREQERIPLRVQIGTSTYEFSPVSRFDGSVSLPVAIVQKAQSLEKQNAALRRLAEREKNSK